MLKGSSSNRRYATQPVNPDPPPATPFAWGFNISNSSQLVTPTGGGLTLTQRRLNELQAGWDVGARFPRIDGETAEADRCRTIGFPKWIVILGSGKNFCSDASALAYLASYPEAWIEPGNELNLGATAWTPATLAARHIAFYSTIKASYPNCTILLASIGNSESTNGNLTPLQWAQGLVANGCTTGTGFDIANYHTYELDYYNWRTVDGSGNSVQKTFGFPNYVFSEWGKRSDGSAGGDATQATTVGQYMDWIIEDPKCVGAHIYAMNDDAEGVGAASAPYGYGLRYLDGTHKPSWNTYASRALAATGWTNVINTQFTADGVLPAPWLAYGPFASGYTNPYGGYYLPSHVIVAGGVCTLLMGYESSGPARPPQAYSATGAGWYQGTIYAGGGFGAIDQRTTVRLRVVSTNGIVSHRNLPLWWSNSGNWPTDGEEDYFESDPAWNPPVAGKELPYGYFHYANPPGVHQFVYNAWPRVDLSQWHVYRMQRLNHKISIWIDDMVTPVWEHQWTALELPDAFKHPVFQQEFPNNTTSPTGTTGSERIEIDWITVDVPGGLVVQNNFETGLTAGTLITIANSDDGSPSAGNPASFIDQGANGASIAYDTAQAAHGTRSLKYTQGTPATGTPNVAWDVASSSTVYGRFYIRVPALPSAAVHIVEFWTGSAYGGFIDLNPSGTLSVVDATFTGKLTTAAVVTANSWFRVELKYDISTTVGAIQLKTFALDSTSAITDDTSTTGNFGAATTGPGHYISAAAPGFVYWLDDIEYNNTGWPGPAA